MNVLPEPKLESDEIGCVLLRTDFQYTKTEKRPYRKIKIGCRNYFSLATESNRFCFVLSDVKKVIL